METADVLIQAGHEGLKSGATGAEGPLGREIDWTPIVADEATRILRNAGVSVIRANANFDLPDRTYSVKAAVFIHFDGTDEPCQTTASVGYPTDPEISSHLVQDAEAASEWKTLYKQYWPFGFMNDNFTSGLNRYYGFKPTTASRGMLLVELGEISCLEQAQWLKPRLKFLGSLIAHFLSQRIGKGNIPAPGQIANVFTVDEPKPGQTKTTSTPIEFKGTANPQVVTVEATVGPGGPFKIGSAKPSSDGTWNFTQTLVTPGRNRPFIFKALDSSGNVLQTIQFNLTLQPSRLGAQPILAPWRSFYAGLNLSGSQIPHQGLNNSKLKETLGMLQEPIGEIVQFAGVDFVKGKVFSFGGSSDEGVSPTETASLTGEILRELSEEDFYCAMRWSFEPNGLSFWKNRRLLVINPLNQKAIIVRAIDWGPNTSTGRILDLSPKALKTLEVETDDEVICAFAKPADVSVGLLTLS